MLRRVATAALQKPSHLPPAACRQLPRPFTLGLQAGARTACSSVDSQSTQGSPPGGFKNIEVMSVDRVRVIGLNRPRQRNAVNRQTARELWQAFRMFDEDQSADVAVLYGKGGNFCAGYDLKELAGAKEGLGEFLQECAPEKLAGPMVCY